MSTKFAVRPAPRKRPWICKRSPPCLKPPAYPPVLICTFALQRRRPLPSQLIIQGTFLLLHIGPGARYNGVWGTGFDYFDCRFRYTIDPPTASAEAFWSAGPSSDHGNYPIYKITPPPLLRYEAAAIQADNWDWWTRVLVTT